MSTLVDIEVAIEKLPTPQIDELALWLEAHRASRAASQGSPATEAWLLQARGAARSGVTTAEAMALTRGEE